MPSTTTAGTTFDSTSWDVEADFVYWDALKAAGDPNVPDEYLLKCGSPAATQLLAWVSRPRRTAKMRAHLVFRLSVRADQDAAAAILLRDRELSSPQLVELARSTSSWQEDGPKRAIAVIDHPNTTTEAIAWVLCYQRGAAVQAAAAARGSLLPFAFRTAAVRGKSLPSLIVPEAVKVAARLERQVPPRLRSLVASLAVTWTGSFAELLLVAEDAAA